MSHCYALALSAAGSNAAWEAGVLYGLAHSEQASEFAYDVVTGVSAGAWNAATAATFAPEEGLAMSEHLSQVWTELNSEMVWKMWPDGEMQGDFHQSGLVDNAPLLDTLKGKFLSEYKRKFALTAVDVETGSYHQFDDWNTRPDELGDAAVASGAIPLLFPPHELAGHWYMDGGTVWGINIDAAIARCHDLVDDMSQITLDVMITDDPELPPDLDPSVVENFKKARDMKDFLVSAQSIAEQMTLYPEVNYRHLFLQKVTVKNELDFSQDATWPLQEEGRANAATVLASTPGKSFQLLEQWLAEESLRGDHDRFAAFYYTNI